MMNTFKKKMILATGVAAMIGALSGCDLTGTGSADLVKDLGADDATNLDSTNLSVNEDKRLWEAMKVILSTKGAANGTTNHAACIGCHSDGATASRKTLPFGNNTSLDGVPTVWYCNNLRAKANVAGAINVMQGVYGDTSSTTKTGTSAFIEGANDSNPTLNRNSRLLEKVGGTAYGLATAGNRMPKATGYTTYGSSSANPNPLTTEQLQTVEKWIAAGAPCWAN